VVLDGFVQLLATIHFVGHQGHEVNTGSAFHHWLPRLRGSPQYISLVADQNGKKAKGA
jgi:hypothetical protein